VKNAATGSNNELTRQNNVQKNLLPDLMALMTKLVEQNNQLIQQSANKENLILQLIEQNEELLSELAEQNQDATDDMYSSLDNED